MKISPLSRDQVRRIDRIAIEQYGMPGVVLMENAGRGAAEAIDRVAPAGDVVILAGKGNNAGDGYVIARHLQLLDRNVKIIAFAGPSTLKGDALVHAKVAMAAGIDILESIDEQEIERAISESNVVVDCILGTGAVGPPRDPFAIAVRVANDADVTRIAIDVPTGMDCDTGQINDPTFQADHTFTFVAPKLGFEKATSHVGNVEVIPIGVPRRLLQQVTEAS